MSRIHCELKKGWDMWRWRAQVFTAFPPAASQNDTIQEGLRPMAMQSSIGVLYETADSMRSNYVTTARARCVAGGCEILMSTLPFCPTSKVQARGDGSDVRIHQ